MESLREIFLKKKTEYIHSTFDVGRSMFDVQRSSVSFSIKLAAFQARRDARMLRDGIDELIP
jgi:hypothetical protein